jgi:ubiquitin C-terminal hydrolase
MSKRKRSIAEASVSQEKAEVLKPLGLDSSSSSAPADEYKNCTHFQHVLKDKSMVAVRKALQSPINWQCSHMSCGTRDDLWLCLGCGTWSCGNFSKGHGEAHFRKFSAPFCEIHAIVITQDGRLWCYRCKDWLLPDGVLESIQDEVKTYVAGLIPSLNSNKRSAISSKPSKSNASLHRSQSVESSTSVESQQLQLIKTGRLPGFPMSLQKVTVEQDKENTAIQLHRRHLVQKTFNLWKNSARKMNSSNGKVNQAHVQPLIGSRNVVRIKKSPTGEYSAIKPSIAVAMSSISPATPIASRIGPQNLKINTNVPSKNTFVQSPVANGTLTPNRPSQPMIFLKPGTPLQLALSSLPQNISVEGKLQYLSMIQAGVRNQLHLIQEQEKRQAEIFLMNQKVANTQSKRSLFGTANSHPQSPPHIAPPTLPLKVDIPLSPSPVNNGHPQMSPASISHMKHYFQNALVELQLRHNLLSKSLEQPIVVPASPVPEPASKKASKQKAVGKKASIKKDETKVKKKLTHPVVVATPERSSAGKGTKSFAVFDQITGIFESPSRSKKVAATPLPQGVCGMRNLGNSCYINSILQALSYVTQFRNEFLSLRLFAYPPHVQVLPYQSGVMKNMVPNASSSIIPSIDEKGVLKTKKPRRSSAATQEEVVSQDSKTFVAKSEPFTFSPVVLLPVSSIPLVRQTTHSILEDMEYVAPKSSNYVKIKKGKAKVSADASLQISEESPKKPKSPLKTDVAPAVEVPKGKKGGKKSASVKVVDFVDAEKPISSDIESEPVFSEQVSQSRDKESLVVQTSHAFRLLWSGKWSIFTPAQLVFAVWRCMPQFASYTQQDAQEFFNCFIESLHEEAKGGGARSSASAAFKFLPNPHLTYKPSSTAVSGTDNSSPSSSLGYGSWADLVSQLRINDLNVDSAPFSPSSQHEDVALPPSSQPNQGIIKTLYGGDVPSIPVPSTLEVVLLMEKENEGKSSKSTAPISEVNEIPHPALSSLPLFPHSRAISKIFDGSTETTVTCGTCHSISTRLESYHCLSLDIHPATSGATTSNINHGVMSLSGRIRKKPSVFVSVPTKSVKAIDTEVVVSKSRSNSVSSLANIGAGTLQEEVRSRSNSVSQPAFTAPIIPPTSVSYSPYSLLSSLHHLVEEESLQDDTAYDCTVCRSRQVAKKQTLLSSLPNAWVFHLNRARWAPKGNGRREKIQLHVSFPLVITWNDIASCLSPSLLKQYEKESSKLTYNLVAVVCHSGRGMDSGHYTTYARPPASDGSSWLYFDDAKVRHGVEPDDVLASQAYMLFYERGQ